MRNGLIINYKTVAALLANSDDNDQFDFFSTFCAELRKCCKTHFNTQAQLSFVAMKLSREDKELLGILGIGD